MCLPEPIVTGAVFAFAARVTTGDHLLRTLSAGYWPVAGVDLSLLAMAAVALLAAGRLSTRRGAAPVKAGIGAVGASHG